MDRTLKGLRADKRLSQADVAQAVGLTYTAYNGIEQAIDNKETLEKIGEMLGAKIVVKVDQ